MQIYKILRGSEQTRKLSPRLIDTTITIRCFSRDRYSSEDHTLLICNTICEMFRGKSDSDLDAVRLFLQALVLIFGRNVLASIRADRILEDASLTLELDEIDLDNEKEMKDLAEDPDTLECLNILGIYDVANPQTIALAYCGAILLLAGKQVTEASATAWTGRRVRGLAASMGTTIELTGVIPFQVQPSIRIYQKLSMLVPLRAKMVRLLFGTTGAGSQIAALSTAMLNLLAWADMNHVRMIQEYIFSRYPEIMALRQLQGHSTGILKTAWTFLKSLDRHERPYAKLLYSSQQTKSLQRDQFILLIDAAHAVGSYLHNSFTNYQGETQGTAGSAIRKIVREYLSSLERAGQSLIQATQYSCMDRQVIENVPRADLLFQQQLSELDAEVRALVRE